MSTTSLTSLTEKQETFSAGVSQKSYNKPSNLNLSPRNLSALTDDTSTSIGAIRNRSVADFQYSQEIGTSASVPSLPLPHEVKECFNRLYFAQDKESESALYEISNLVAEWLIDAPNEYHTIFAGYLQKMPLMSSRILMATLSDAELSTSNESLLYSVSSFLKSTDKRLAQTAAIFLLICGGTLGKELLLQGLSTQKLPHVKLIQGISKLLS